MGGAAYRRRVILLRHHFAWFRKIVACGIAHRVCGTQARTVAARIGQRFIPALQQEWHAHCGKYRREETEDSAQCLVGCGGPMLEGRGLDNVDARDALFFQYLVQPRLLELFAMQSVAVFEDCHFVAQRPNALFVIVELSHLTEQFLLLAQQCGALVPESLQSCPLKQLFL